MKILVLGVTGMLGNAVFRVFAADAEHEVWGTLRSGAALRYFPQQSHAHLLTGVDVLDQDALVAVLAKVRPIDHSIRVFQRCYDFVAVRDRRSVGNRGL